MNKQKKLPKLTERGILQSAVCIGMILLVLTTAFSCYREYIVTTKAAENAISTLKQQCISFNKLTAADRTKSLFRLSDMIRDLSTHLARNPELATDTYLEQYVDSLRLSGVALLNENLELEASGYTRQFRDANWTNTREGDHISDIIDYPTKIYAERILIDNEYYDVCAVARKDISGIVIGYYRQPSGLITDMEDDLESLLSGLHLEKDGHYVIAENGTIRVTSDETENAIILENSLLQNLASISKDGRLHLFRSEGHYYWGYHSGCENYTLYVYYPILTVFTSSFLTAALFAAGYSIILLLFFTLRHKALYKNQEILQKSNHDLTQTVRMLQSLETIYFSLFYVDLNANCYETIYIAPWLRSASIPQKGVYTELKQTFLDSMIVQSFRNDVDYRMSIPFIRENLNLGNLTDARKSFYTDYQAIRGHRTPWCRVTATAVDFDDHGKPLHALALIQDIDKEKAIEANYQAQILKEVNDAKIANNAKSEFLRRISHDIRTPINGILGYINLADSHPEDISLQENCRKNISIALHTLLDLVNGILDMSKLESSEIVLEETPFDLTKLLDDVNTILTPQATARNVRLEALRTAPVPITHLIGSPRLLSQVIMNVTSNAVKYAKPGGYVRVNTHLISHTEDIVTYCFVCEDKGIGMSEEFQKHMYEPFVQESSSARTTYQGVGLGLSIVKKLVDAMGGTITCQSEKDKGTTFRIQITFKIDHQTDAATSLPANDESLLNGLRILLTEDNELNMEIADFLLTERGAAVTKAYNGKEAVRIFSASAPGSFDMILMDIMMPEMNGLEAARAIRTLNRADAEAIPIIAMSANSFQDDVKSCLDAGMNEHISKPIDPLRLCSTLKKYVRET